MKRRVFILLLCLLGLVGWFCQPAMGDSITAEQVVLVLWHGLDWEDLEGLQFDAPVATGLLNTRAAGGEPLSASYLSIGAGARVVGLSGAAVFYQSEEGKGLFRRHTGLEPTHLVQPKIAQIQAAQDVKYRIELGALGTAFAEAGVPLRVLGNSEGVEPFSWGALVGMDGWGRVWEGNVGTEFLLLEPMYPYGVRTDYTRLAEEVLQSEEPLIIVDLGDLFRYDQYRHQFIAEQGETMRDLITHEAQLFLEGLVGHRPSQTVVFLVSAYPSQRAAGRGFWLTPVLCWGLTEGLLISGTTRWPGLITNMDLAPTILHMLDIDHELPLIGRVASIEPAPVAEAVSVLELMAGKIGFLSQYRSKVLRGVVIGQILTYTAILVSLILAVDLPNWAVSVLRIALLLLLATPLGLLLWDLSPLLVLVLGGGIGFLKYRQVASVSLVGLISVSTTLGLTIDVLLGSWLMRYSFLGYDPIGGARFYGIGNEYMGVLIGAAIMGWAILVEGMKLSVAWRNVLGILILGFLTVVIGSPSLGTNVGGTISAVFGFGATWIAFSGKKANLRTLVGLAVVALAVLGILMFIDSVNSHAEQSHIGQTVELIRRDGLAAVFLIITRKVAMNIKLLRYSMWSNALIVALVGMGASFIWPSKYIYWLKENHPIIARGMIGVVIASIAAFFFNDSGVVAAATCLSFASSTLLLLALELKHNLTSSQPNVKNNGNRD